MSNTDEINQHLANIDDKLDLMSGYISSARGQTGEIFRSILAPMREINAALKKMAEQMDAASQSFEQLDTVADEAEEQKGVDDA